MASRVACFIAAMESWLAEVEHRGAKGEKTVVRLNLLNVAGGKGHPAHQPSYSGAENTGGSLLNQGGTARAPPGVL